MILKSQAIKNFLTANTLPELADRYTIDMECQVNVAQDGGEPIEGEWQGRRWQGWTDHITIWKAFRIPYNANKDANYSDTIMTWDLESHAEAIGMTGWNWRKRCSQWVVFDFDAITGHSENHTHKLDDRQLEEVRMKASEIPWVTVRKSTSGNGLHLYVFLNDVPTENHHEHAALARAIIGTMSALVGIDFSAKVDNCGGNFWVWRRGLTKEGLSLVKQGSVLTELPPNWKKHIDVVKGKVRRTLPQEIAESDNVEKFGELASQQLHTPLDEEHRKLIDYLKDNSLLWWWEQDYHMLVTHTYSLKQAHEALGFKGIFDTVSTGTGLGMDHNCYAFPMRKGGWSIRRFSPGAQEKETWTQDAGGWTQCYYNKDPDLAAACRAHGGLEDEKGGFVFREAEMAINAARLLGVSIDIGPSQMRRHTTLKQRKQDGKLIVKIEKDSMDRADEMIGWLPKKDDWIKVYSNKAPVEELIEVGNYDDMVRHIVTNANEDSGWVIKVDEEWRSEPLIHVTKALSSIGLGGKESSSVIGNSIFKAWKLVTKPFQPEYTGNREWNKNSAKFRFTILDTDILAFPHWKKILNHCGAALDEAVKIHPWCKVNGIQTGADYLKCWISSMFQYPGRPLPYLFFYGPQNSGKSVFHEALSLLFTRGHVGADSSLINQGGFNGELEGVVLCYVEETDLSNNKTAYNRIKSWVTGREIMIHPKRGTPYHTTNTTHWVQCANDHKFCPTFTGDTRITMIYVENLDPIDLIPKEQFFARLTEEAPAFLTEVLRVDLPEPNDRLNVPVISTQDKKFAERLNQSPLEEFLTSQCYQCNGYWVKLGDFCNALYERIDPIEIRQWSKIRIGKELPPKFPKGRNRKDGQFYVGNISFKPEPAKTVRYELIGDYLEITHDN